MRILILTQQYPKKDDIYRNGFVHTRIKRYLDETNDEYEVFVLNGKENKYIYDEVSVLEGSDEKLRELLVNEVYDKIIVHFLTRQMIPVLMEEKFNKIKKLIWVHGYEALSWKRRIFNIFDFSFPKYVYDNQLQLRNFRKYLSSDTNSTFVFVSEWMKNIAEKDIKAKFSNYEILPNGIDTKKFNFLPKQHLRKNVLMIRPFNSRKYATDIACKAIELLSKEKNFSEYSITIVGEGQYFEKDTRIISQYDNVHLINRFLTSDEIVQLHSENGIFLCPTRQDAQGVSMCEAMSSGLVAVASNNTAIPEFVDDGLNGLLCKNANDICSAIIKISNDDTSFDNISRNARKRILEKCDLNEIVWRELKLIDGENK
ncbi:glycosyltransferase family 4 protein [Enterococcus hirae]|uniref:glycosyltransferase family 4 protein n=1 Tax=Enterococcus hirae TaxID=1354 RepID=UPI0013630583|nr:glycosyltransferase family 4 protein [Enterococcus hirae]EMF0068469.1 glycosyltransferase family 4 protein [Enterococcus hirae]EMF0165037.1 glycosyltransferase family 4 protein [Enterococcus hirae]EMF0424408.1 glycosyltransferase family 4 protein [Enterococcus hirae]MCD4958117.1 glycosyltransferase family 4 protein [Enterococcus hirae]MDT2653650.1 glycosyltransferase family 4 protein [Enterococcus hirae]